MKRVMVRYKVKPGRGEENEAFIRRVFEELEAAPPDGLRYASFKLGDGVSFIHLASVETEDGNPLTELASFRDFQAELKERCEEPPHAIELYEIGSYRFFSEKARQSAEPTCACFE